MSEEEDIPFSVRKDASASGGPTPGVQGPTVRTGVDAGVKVIDLNKMREELDKDPRSHRQW
jgi:hypothetical protein